MISLGDECLFEPAPEAVESTIAAHEDMQSECVITKSLNHEDTGWRTLLTDDMVFYFYIISFKKNKCRVSTEVPKLLDLKMFTFFVAEFNFFLCHAVEFGSLLVFSTFICCINIDYFIIVHVLSLEISTGERSLPAGEEEQEETISKLLLSLSILDLER